MYLSEEIAALCVKAAHETDSQKLLVLTKKINELLEEEEQRKTPPKKSVT